MRQEEAVNKLVDSLKEDNPTWALEMLRCNEEFM